MNTKLLERVREEIVLYPQRFSAAHWAFARNAAEVIRREEAPRGFKCCIAGHTLLVSERSSERDLLCRSGLHNNDGSLYQRAGEALGLAKAQRLELFFPSQWDAPYKQEYYLCSREAEAEVCAAYIDYFMSKHGLTAEEAAGPAAAAPVAAADPVALPA